MTTPDPHYVNSLLVQLQRELEGFHRKVSEIEALRYGEDDIRNTAAAKPSRLEVRAGLTADHIKTVTASLTANRPRTKVKALRKGDKADGNSSTREQFWDAWLAHQHKTIVRWIDATVGNGLGFLKGVRTRWPVEPRKRLKDEKDRIYNNRMRTLKRQWGPPFAALNPHTMTCYWRLGAGDRIAEVIEHSWRPKVEVYAQYQIESDRDVAKKAMSSRTLDKGVETFRAGLVGSVTG